MTDLVVTLRRPPGAAWSEADTVPGDHTKGRRTRPRWSRWGLEGLGLALALVLAWFLWPTNLGGATTVVVVAGRSMEPTYQTGDLIVARRGTPAVGDVVVFQPAQDGRPLPLVIHRIVGGDATTGFTTQGDGNPNVDPWHPTADQVQGIAVVRVPWVGHLTPLLRNPIPWALCIGAAVVVALWPRDRRSAGPADGEAGADPPGGEPADG